MTDDLSRLARIRWAVRAVLWLGIAVSVAANILHARSNPVSQAIAAWPPVALFLTVELISRVPVARRMAAGLRISATGVISGIAAWVSYWHMAGVAQRYGEQGAAPYLIPLTVDGLIVVASVCLVEIGARVIGLTREAAEVKARAEAAARAAEERAMTRAAARVMTPVPVAPYVRPAPVTLAKADPERVTPDPAERVTPLRDDLAVKRAERAEVDPDDLDPVKLAELRAACRAAGKVIDRGSARAVLGVKTSRVKPYLDAIREEHSAALREAGA